MVPLPRTLYDTLGSDDRVFHRLGLPLNLSLSLHLSLLCLIASGQRCIFCTSVPMLRWSAECLASALLFPILPCSSCVRQRWMWWIHRGYMPPLRARVHHLLPPLQWGFFFSLSTYPVNTLPSSHLHLVSLITPSLKLGIIKKAYLIWNRPPLPFYHQTRFAAHCCAAAARC